MNMTKHREVEPEFSAAGTNPATAKKSASASPAEPSSTYGGRVVPMNGTELPRVATVRPQQDFIVEFGSIGFVLAWLGIYGLHVVSAIYFILCGWLYDMLSTSHLGMNLDLYSLALPTKYFPFISAVHSIVAAIHLSFLVIPALRYVYPTWSLTTSLRRLKHWGLRVSHHLERSRSSRLVASGVKAIMKHAYAILFARRGFFGVESNYFETIFLVREVIETSLQAYQAFTMSRLLPRHMLNRFYVIVQVINCWSTPFLSHFVKHKPTQRLVCILGDVFLDFISSIGIPAYLALSYVPHWDSERNDFPAQLWYNDKWLVNMMNEFPIILLGSAIGAMSRLIFSISLLISMEDAKALVSHRRYNRQKIASLALTNSDNSAIASFSVISITVPRISTKALGIAATIPREKILRWGHRMMIAFGLVVVALQIQAEAKTDSLACLMELRPWLVSERACALVEINCHSDKSLTGNLSNFDDMFGNLHSSSLEHVVYRHCPQVEFGPRIATFINLKGMKIYNSTVVRWEEDAALTQAHHPNLRFAFFVFTNFTNGALPPGLISHAFPRLLLDVEFSVTNIRGLPSDIATRWPPNLNLYFERGLLNRIPDEYETLRPPWAVLAGNHITDLTQEILDVKGGMATLILSGNPIQRISDNLNGTKCLIRKIHLDATNISTLPMWMDAKFFSKTIVNAGRTPLCRDVLLKKNDTATKELLAKRPYLSKVLCADIGYDRTGLYPLATEIRADEVW